MGLWRRRCLLAPASGPGLGCCYVHLRSFVAVVGGGIGGEGGGADLLRGKEVEEDDHVLGLDPFFCCFFLSLAQIGSNLSTQFLFLLCLVL